MAVQAISNDNLLNYRDRVDISAFVPVVTYVYDAAVPDIDIRQTSTFPTGLYLSKVHVRVHDKFGGEVRGTIVEEPGSGVVDEITINVAALNRSRPLDITATMILTDGKTVADGSAIDIGAAGSVSKWDIQSNA